MVRVLPLGKVTKLVRIAVAVAVAVVQAVVAEVEVAVLISFSSTTIIKSYRIPPVNRDDAGWKFPSVQRHSPFQSIPFN